MARRVIRGHLITLRPLRLSDAGVLDPVLRDRRATRFLRPWVRYETGREFVVRVLRDQRKGHSVAFAIVPAGSTKAIGQTRLFHWSRTNDVAEVGFWLRRKYWGRGFGTEALRLICQYGFRTMSLHRIEAVVIEGNVGSRRALKKIGFRDEGRSRQAHRLAGRWVNEWRLGLLRGEMPRSAPPKPGQLPGTRPSSGS